MVCCLIILWTFQQVKVVLYFFLFSGPQMFVEVWLHQYSLEMYQKLQSPQVKVGCMAHLQPLPLSLSLSLPPSLPLSSSSSLALI